MREAIGDDFDILLDAHGSPTPELSLAFAETIAEYRPLFLEEPVKIGSVEALLEVSLTADAVTPNFLIQEMNQTWFERFGDYVDHDWQIADGHISVSDAPGVGVTVKTQDRGTAVRADAVSGVPAW